MFDAQKGSRQDMARVALRSSRSFSYPTVSASSALAFALRVGEAGPTGAPKPRLLDRGRVAIRARHYSHRTEKAYVASIRRYIFFHDKRHPADMGAPEVTRFLSSLAVEGKVAASTQNQALSAPCSSCTGRSWTSISRGWSRSSAPSARSACPSS